MKVRSIVIACFLAGSCLATSGALAASASIDAAIADPGRPADELAMDATRKPAQLLAAARLKPGQRIVDVFPGPYWDRLFADVVGPKGKVVMYMPMEMVKAENIPLPKPGTPALTGHPNVSMIAAAINDFAMSEPVDVVWIRQNYHDLYDPFMGPANVPAFNKAVFAALRRGGRYVIIDHSAPDGSGLADANTTHRVDEAIVKRDMAAAGFVLETESNVLRNPADDRSKLVFDKSIRGHTDQFVLIYRKP